MLRPNVPDSVSQAIQRIAARLDCYDDPLEDIAVDTDERVVGFSFPSSEGADYDYDEVEVIAAELDSLRTDLPQGRVTIQSRRYQLVYPDSVQAHRIIEEDIDATVKHVSGAELCVRRYPLAVVISAVEHDAYHKHYWSPTSYTAIELVRPSSQRLSEREELEIIDSYLFELATSHDAIFSVRGFNIETDYYPDDEEEAHGEVPITLDQLEPFNEGMRLYLAAVQVADPELELLSLYKVLEYFSPTAASLEAHEAMRRRLDSRRGAPLDGAFIRSVFDLARSFEVRRTDKEMMVTLFGAAVDVIALTPRLPTSIRPRVTDLSKRAEIASATRDIAEVLVATRNQLAHAKANYTPTGKEVSPDDLPQFNRFVRAAAEAAIRWYNQLPLHQRDTTSGDESAVKSRS